MQEDQNLPESDSKPNNLLGAEPASDLGVKLRALRHEFVAAGGQLLSREELCDEIAERRGGADRIAHEKENLR